MKSKIVNNVLHEVSKMRITWNRDWKSTLKLEQRKFFKNSNLFIFFILQIKLKLNLRNINLNYFEENSLKFQCAFIYFFTLH